jgi:thiol-disulfide isomerase/thioredoxin
MKKIILALIGLVPMVSHAQQVIIECADTTLLSGSMLISETHPFEKLSFDRKGTAIFNDPTAKEKTQLQLLLGDGTGYAMIIEPGKTQRVRFSRGKDGKLQVQYKGDNTALAEFYNEYARFIPEKNSGYEMANPSADTITYAEAHRRLVKRYRQLVKMGGKLDSHDEQQDKLRDVKLAYLANRLELLADEAYKFKRDPNKDTLYMALVAQINPNDTLYLQRGLADTYVRSRIPFMVTRQTPVGVYGAAYVTAVDENISNPQVRNILIENVVNTVLGQIPADQTEAFWKVVTAKADSSIVSQYQYIVDAQKSTKRGMKCPDVTFSDPNGKQHRLSDYFGRVLYIDLWATWCVPCMMEIPALARHVEQYKNDPRVQFISISMDRNQKAWHAKLEKDRPQWSQFIVNSTEDAIISKEWGVMSIPRFLLINADGTILDADTFRPTDTEFVTKLNAVLPPL